MNIKSYIVLTNQFLVSIKTSLGELQLQSEKVTGNSE